MFEREGICRPIKLEEDSMPIYTLPHDANDDYSKVIQDTELDPKVANNDILEIPSQKNMDSGCGPSHQITSGKAEEDSPESKDNHSLSPKSHQLENEADTEYTIDRWFEERVDPFEIPKRALIETLASEPELTTFAIPLFESQWKLEALALSPGVVSCATEDSSGQTYTPSYSESHTRKRSSQTQWRGSSQPGRVPGEEGEEDEEEGLPQKRQKGIKEPEDGSAKRKFGCPFHKRHPTIYCVNKDPNIGTKEQKKWSVCAGQGFPYLRHLM
jgi:hypothetical protein